MLTLVTKAIKQAFTLTVFLASLGTSQAVAEPITNLKLDRAIFTYYAESIRSARNKQPARQSMYNLCLFQMKWETSWEVQSKRNQQFYTSTLAPIIDNLVKTSNYNKHETCLGYLTTEDLKGIAFAFGVKPIRRNEVSERILLNYPDGYVGYVEFPLFIFGE